MWTATRNVLVQLICNGNPALGATTVTYDQTPVEALGKNVTGSITFKDDGTTNLDWTATSSATWLKLNVAAGTTTPTSTATLKESGYLRRDPMFGIEIIDAALLPAMLVALVAGVLSFLSPCVLPIVPPYLAYMGGISMGEMRGGSAARRRVILPALVLRAGAVDDLPASGFHRLGLRDFRACKIRRFWPASGLVVIIFGLHFLGVFRIADSGSRDADGCGRPGRFGAGGLCAGPGLRLRLDPLHRPATGRDPEPCGAGRQHAAGHAAAGGLCARAGAALPYCSDFH